MDSVPATVPSVTPSPGDSELLGPLSVLYAALIAKLLEVTAPIPGEGPQPWRARVGAVGAPAGRGSPGVGQARGGRTLRCCRGRREGGGDCRKASALVRSPLVSQSVPGTVLFSGTQSGSLRVPFHGASALV